MEPNYNKCTTIKGEILIQIHELEKNVINLNNILWFDLSCLVII
jgi:hypothetical protein